MGCTMTVAHDPSAPAGHLPALRAGRNENKPSEVEIHPNSASGATKRAISPST